MQHRSIAVARGNDGAYSTFFRSLASLSLIGIAKASDFGVCIRDWATYVSEGPETFAFEMKSILGVYTDITVEQGVSTIYKLMAQTVGDPGFPKICSYLPLVTTDPDSITTDQQLGIIYQQLKLAMNQTDCTYPLNALVEPITSCEIVDVVKAIGTILMFIVIGIAACCGLGLGIIALQKGVALLTGRNRTVRLSETRPLLNPQDGDQESATSADNGYQSELSSVEMGNE
ncbi:hypothetical protein EBR96_01450 [bacterium]|nr:hypothetical protein [bacterium]